MVKIGVPAGARVLWYTWLPWVLIFKLGIMVVSAYLFLDYSFSGFLTESRRHGLGYLQSAVVCPWLVLVYLHTLRQLYAPW